MHENMQLISGMPEGTFHRDDAIEHSGRYGGQDWCHSGQTYTPAVYFSPDLLSGSDYSGGSIEKANHREFLDRHGSIAGVYDLAGEYGTFGVAIHADLLTAEPAEDSPLAEMVSDLRGLCGYPVLDDDAVSDVEMESEMESWESYGASDFRGELPKIAAVAFGFSDEVAECLSFAHLSDDTAFGIYRELADISNVYPEYESGGTYFPTPGEWNGELARHRMKSNWTGRSFVAVLAPLMADAVAHGSPVDFERYAAGYRADLQTLAETLPAYILDIARGKRASGNFEIGAIRELARLGRIVLHLQAAGF